jgi:hypothetical protein
MKRFLLCTTLILASAAASAQVVTDRDVLVTPEGTVFTVENATPSTGTPVSAIGILDMGIRNGADVRHITVPGSTTAGYHSGATLAYDTDSKTLFVLWIHLMDGVSSSELLLAAYRDGKWQQPVAIDRQQYTMRTNLRLGITRRVSQLQKDGSYADAPALLLHALWWDDSMRGEEARYAMLPIENGALSASSIEVHGLEEFVPAGDDEFNAAKENFNAEILRHPAIITSPMQSTVGVVFGDTKRNTIHNVTLHPIADARVHIPVGIGGGGREKPEPHIIAPLSFSSDWKGSISVIAHADRLIFANADGKSLNYITYSNDTWSTVKSIAIDAKLPAEAALAAIDKMVSSQ